MQRKSAGSGQSFERDFDACGVFDAELLEWGRGDGGAESGLCHGVFESGDEFHATIFIAVDGGEQVVDGAVESGDFE